MGKAAVGFVQKIDGQREVIWVTGRNAGKGKLSLFARVASYLSNDVAGQSPSTVVPNVVDGIRDYISKVDPSNSLTSASHSFPNGVEHTLHLVDFDYEVVTLVNPWQFEDVNNFTTLVDFSFSEFHDRY